MLWSLQMSLQVFRKALGDGCSTLIFQGGLLFRNPCTVLKGVALEIGIGAWRSVDYIHPADCLLGKTDGNDIP